ncbi:MAG: serine/threonine-protein kinase [Myxococcota bacterium]
MDDPWLGARLGNYQIDALLGRGGMASVYRAEHVALGTRHAVKILDPLFARHEEVRARFLREGRVQAQFKHPGIAVVTDTVSSPAVALVMELLEGESLREVLERGPISVGAASIVFEDLADALIYAHGKGVVHRDVKPDNVFLAEEEDESLRPVLLDFGIARIDTMNAITRAGIKVGTPLYMSPEQVDDPRQVDGRADVFSLGVVLFEMLTGTTPHEGDTPREIALSMLRGRIPRVSERSAAPRELDAVITRALAPDPELRFPTMAAFRDAVRAALEGSDASDAAPARGPFGWASREATASTVPPIPEEKVAAVLAERAALAPCPACGADGTGLDHCVRCGARLG